MTVHKIITPSPKKHKFPTVICDKSPLIIKFNLIHKGIVTNMLLYDIVICMISLIKFKTRTCCDTTG